MTLEELMDQLSKHNIKVVDYDENEDSIKNRLFSMVGEKPRGHIGPSSWLEPTGELTIYVPKSKDTPEKLKRFLIEEVKHADQLRENPFSSGLSSIYEKIKEEASTIPSKLLNMLPDFVSEEEDEEHFQKMMELSEAGKDQEWFELESPYWKDRSGIGQLFRDLHYNRYADPHSVEGIHSNEERYGPVLEKYGIAGMGEAPAGMRKGAAKVGKQAGGLIMNYGDYGRNYK